MLAGRGRIIMTGVALAALVVIGATAVMTWGLPSSDITADGDNAPALGIVSSAGAAEREMSAADAAGSAEDVAAPLLDEPLWKNFRDRFVHPDGRVIDDANGSISHSEGQGYGMLLAAFAGDRETFDRIWVWTETELLIRDDGLAAWRWEPEADPHVTDANNATDGDILIAWALVEGADHFGEDSFLEPAGKIADAIFETVVETGDYGPVLLPGAQGFRAEEQPDGPVINLSYWVFPAFPKLAAAFPGHDWGALRQSGLALLRDARFEQDLPSDWIALGGEAPRPARGFDPTFAYNAIRIPLYLAHAKAGERGDLAPFVALWGEDKPPFTLDVKTGQQVDQLGGAGYRAVAALAACAMEGKPIPETLRTPVADHYYPTVLQALSLVAAQESYSGCH
jgi:endoglucanase